MKPSFSLYLIVAFSAMIFDLGILVPASVAGEENLLYTVRRRRARTRNASRGVMDRRVEPDAKTNKGSSIFTVEQMATYRRLGIDCGGGETGGDDDDGLGKAGGKSGGTGGDDDDGFGKAGGKSGGTGGDDDDGNGKSGYGSRRRHRRRRRTAMRAFRSGGECICDEEWGVCWTYGDPYDDSYCCLPDDGSPIPPPVSAPVQAPVASPIAIPTLAPFNLAPPTPEVELSNDMPTLLPGVI